MQIVCAFSFCYLYQWQIVIHSHWRTATENEKNLIFKINQTFSDLGGAVVACLNAWGQLKDFSKDFFSSLRAI